MRIALDSCPSTTGTRIVLESHGNTYCAPCPPAPDPTTPAAQEARGRVIIRDRVEIDIDDDGIAQYGWTTIYDGDSIWSPITTTENDDTAGVATQTATVTIPELDTQLSTSASLWDHNQHRWSITRTIADTVLTITRPVDDD